MINVAIIEDNRLVRDGLSLKLNEEADFTVSYSDAMGSIDALRDANPHVLLLDVGLEGHDSLELAARVRGELAETQVIVMDLLPVHEDLVEFINVGVAGFILKDATLEQLVTTIRSVAGGQPVLPPAMTSTLFAQIVEEAVLQGSPGMSGATDLTSREREVIGLIGDGMSNKAIAKDLGISPHTVKSHVRNVMDKLALHSRLQIAAYLHKTTEPADEE
ncbi:MAG TPA: response regulator transcription factor [Longimicrobiales bacterium]|nr:response regulator transcription factor [Longimicrobiales bacterium]